jgi:hypothetical protein
MIKIVLDCPFQFVDLIFSFALKVRLMALMCLCVSVYMLSVAIVLRIIVKPCMNPHATSYFLL